METKDTSGFYKNDNGFLSYGKNFVVGLSQNLYREQKDGYTYPQENWYWFDTEEEARQFFGILRLPEPSPRQFPQDAYLSQPPFST